MKFVPSLCLSVAALFVAAPLKSQNVNMEHPQEINVQHRPSAEEIRDRLNASQIQNDASELAQLCSSVVADMDSVKQGLLPKDVADKLKRLEKLSKRTRESLTKVSQGVDTSH